MAQTQWENRICKLIRQFKPSGDLAAFRNNYRSACADIGDLPPIYVPVAMRVGVGSCVFRAGVGRASAASPTGAGPEHAAANAAGVW